MKKSVSIIILTKNAACCLPKLLGAIANQELDLEFELLVIDSSSTDATREIAHQAGAKVVIIDQEDFDHGGTRSKAARMARGEILVYLTQDALPCSEKSVANLIQPLLDNAMVAACCGRQLPYEDATLFGAHLRLFNYGNASVLRGFTDRKQYGLKSIFISNSFAAYRKETLAKVGFFGEHEIFAEDAAAVGKMLQQGHMCAYVAEAQVYHSHNYSIMQEFRRYFDVGAFHRRHYWLLEAYGGVGGEGMRYIVSELKYLIDKKRPDLLPLSLLRNALKFIGYKTGLHYEKLPNALVPYCSMNRPWWSKNNK